MVSARLLVAASLLALALLAAAPPASAQHIVCLEGGALGCGTAPGNLVEVHAAGHDLGVRDPCYTTDC